MVCRFIQQQQIRFQKQGAREGNTHAPPTGEFRQRPRLRRGIKTKPGKNGGRTRRRAIGANGDQPFMNFRNAGGISGGFRFREQGRAFLIRRQHGFQQAGRARWKTYQSMGWEVRPHEVTTS
jgi:hypothetical protein